MKVITWNVADLTSQSVMGFHATLKGMLSEGDDESRSEVVVLMMQESKIEDEFVDSVFDFEHYTRIQKASIASVGY